MTYRQRLAAIAEKPTQHHVPAVRHAERRWALRKTGIYAGFLIFDSMQGTACCIVRDMSATGARLEVVAGRSSIIIRPEALPDRFVLLLEKENIEVACAIVWRNAVSVGVRFVSPMKHLPKRASFFGGGKPGQKR